MTTSLSTSQTNRVWHRAALGIWALIALAFLAFYLIDLRLDYIQIQNPCQGEECNWRALRSMSGYRRLRVHLCKRRRRSPRRSTHRHSRNDWKSSVFSDMEDNSVWWISGQKWEFGFIRFREKLSFARASGYFTVDRWISRIIYRISTQNSWFGAKLSTQFLFPRPIYLICRLPHGIVSILWEYHDCNSW